ncbi:MAG: SRPBCC domain-containing protein [Chloroflexota bacterium]|nr:SRPBCC domain-containing protein [Chloroflexota bacterium]
MNVETTDTRLRVEVELAAPVDRAWVALTAPDALSEWWGNYVRLAPEVGGELREEWTDDTGRVVVTTGIVMRCEPPVSLAMTWADEDWPGATTVAFTLAEHGGGRTVLRLEHAGWDALPVDRRRALIEAHAAGWRDHLESLRSYLRRG